MTQFDFGTIDPFVIGGVTLTSWLNQWRDAVHSLHRGPARPAYVVPGMMWVNDAGGNTAWIVNLYTGPTVGDVALFAINTTTGAITLSPTAASIILRDGAFLYTPYDGAADTGVSRVAIQFDGHNNALGFYTANTYRGGIQSDGIWRISPPPVDSNDTAVPTTAWVRANGGGAKTGDTVMTYRNVADPGWIVHNDGTIGDASSGGTARANADTQNLFNLFWPNPNCTIAGGKGASAAADWAAHKPLKLPPQVGRAIGVAGAGAGLTARNAGDAVGAENVSYGGNNGGNTGGAGINPQGGGWAFAQDGHIHSFGFTVNIMQPTGFLYLHIKL